MNACTGQASKKSIVADGYMIKRRENEELLFGVTNGYDGTCQTMIIVFPVLLDNHLPWMPPVFDIFPSFLLFYE